MEKSVTVPFYFLALIIIANALTISATMLIAMEIHSRLEARAEASLSALALEASNSNCCCCRCVERCAAAARKNEFDMSEASLGGGGTCGNVHSTLRGGAGPEVGP